MNWNLKSQYRNKKRVRLSETYFSICSIIQSFTSVVILIIMSRGEGRYENV